MTHILFYFEIFASFYMSIIRHGIRSRIMYRMTNSLVGLSQKLFRRLKYRRRLNTFAVGISYFKVKRP